MVIVLCIIIKYCIEMCRIVDSYFCFDRSYFELGRFVRLVWYLRLFIDIGYFFIFGLCFVYYVL